MRALIEPFGAEPPDWMNNSDWALPGLVIVYLWKNVGFAALIYLAGLQGLPKELDEAAAIDGASTGPGSGAIKLPLLAPITFFLLITT